VYGVVGVLDFDYEICYIDNDKWLCLIIIYIYALSWFLGVPLFMDFLA
jgi:hypothetical protein